ncbi:hypothetical protein D1632_16535 [Chryseobacterium nematophagum]|uniref:Uncharacterized protein n=1 Tax=Chryseobacterium nematophagum TaxID=2305228 RepID=A0A3M7L8X6_9FLAO|nr:hypothetical protein [Chryseobacterium nematophagum]RMZ57916.1 hypothetical protein D1632_16535 [Chryseobacterium nematophagum]
MWVKSVSGFTLPFVAKHFGIAVDDIIFFNEKKQYSQLGFYGRYCSSGKSKTYQRTRQRGKNILLKLIETFISKKRFKDYLEKNIAVLYNNKSYSIEWLLFII